MQDQEVTQRTETEKKEDTISLLDLVLIITKRWRFIISFCFILGTIILAYLMITKYLPADSPYNTFPDFYQPEVKILMNQSSSSSALSNILGSDEGLGTLASLAGIGGGPSSDAVMAEALLYSNTTADRVAEEFNFLEYYGISETPRYSTRLTFTSNISFMIDESTGIVTISYTDTDREFARDVLNYTVSVLQERFISLTHERTIRKREFLENRVADVEDDLEAAQQTMVDFQRRHGIIDISSQAEYQVSQISSLSSQMYQKEIELQNLLDYLEESNPRVIRLQNEIDIIQQLINELRSGFNEFSAETIPQDQIPSIAAEFGNLTMDLEIQRAIYTMLRQQLETVKIEEQNDTRTFQILEEAELLERKSGPSRGKILILSAIAIFFSAIFLCFIFEYFERVKRDPEEADKINRIKQSFRLSKKK